MRAIWAVNSRDHSPQRPHANMSIDVAWSVASALRRFSRSHRILAKQTRMIFSLGGNLVCHWNSHLALDLLLAQTGFKIVMFFPQLSFGASWCFYIMQPSSHESCLSQGLHTRLWALPGRTCTGYSCSHLVAVGMEVSGWYLWKSRNIVYIHILSKSKKDYVCLYIQISVIYICVCGCFCLRL